MLFDMYVLHTRQGYALDESYAILNAKMSLVGFPLFALDRVRVCQPGETPQRLPG